ncbi:MAG: glycosyltransferase [Alphaproteobacteria bacterium]
MSGARPVLVAAGGTGGHVFPAVALTEALVARGRAVTFVTDPRGAALLDRGIALPDGARRIVLPAGHLAGGVAAKTRALAGLARGFLAARRLVRDERPAAAIGFGGYPTVAPLLAARLAGVPMIVHEANALLGAANRFLATRASACALTFADTAGLPAVARGRVRVVGNPVRADIAALVHAPYAPPAPGGRVALFVIGGSLGARQLAVTVPEAVAMLPAALRARLSVAQQVRADDRAAAEAAWRKAGVAAEMAPFFVDVPRRLATAHIVVARAGASTVAELIAAGRPAILVPWKHAAGDHQTANAAALTAAGGGWAFAEDAFTPAALAGCLRTLIADPAALAAAAAAVRRAGPADAAQRLADLVDEVAQTQLRPARNAGRGTPADTNTQHREAVA